MQILDEARAGAADTGQIERCTTLSAQRGNAAIWAIAVGLLTDQDLPSLGHVRACLHDPAGDQVSIDLARGVSSPFDAHDQRVHGTVPAWITTTAATHRCVRLRLSSDVVSRRAGGTYPLGQELMQTTHRRAVHRAFAVTHPLRHAESPHSTSCEGCLLERKASDGYFRATLPVIDAMTSDAILNCASRLVMPWRRAIHWKSV